MIKSAREAREIIAQHGDPYKCDWVVDRAAWEAIGGLDAIKEWPEVRALVDALEFYEAQGGEIAGKVLTAFHAATAEETKP